MTYVDGFLLVVPNKKLAAYAAIAKQAGKVWKELGALEYRECAAEDMTAAFGIPFPKRVSAKKGETVVFSWITYKSRAHRDRVNKKVMKDPRMLAMCGKQQPFDLQRMSYGGFTVLVEM